MITSIVLAGGRSLRLGKNKASEELVGESLLHRAVRCVSELGGPVVVVVGQNPSPIPDLPATVVADIYPGRGAVGGLYTGLVASRTPYSLAVACDMPFLNLELLRYLIGLSPGFQAVVPRVGWLLEPLHAVYSRDCLPVLERMLQGEQPRLYEFFPQVKTRYVEKEEIDRFDPQHLSFFNINTGADLERARSLLAERR